MESPACRKTNHSGTVSAQRVHQGSGMFSSIMAASVFLQIVLICLVFKRLSSLPYMEVVNSNFRHFLFDIIKLSVYNRKQPSNSQNDGTLHQQARFFATWSSSFAIEYPPE